MNEQPRFLEAHEDISEVMASASANLTLPEKIRKESALYMLKDEPTLIYASIATGQTKETMRVKLLRSLDLGRSVDELSEADDFKKTMTNSK